MEQNKLEIITKLFEQKEIRSAWDIEKEEYYFSVVDVIYALTDSINPNDYWYRLKTRLTEEEKSELSTKCRKLKLKAQDGKYRETDTLDTKGILRLIESVPSPKAEPFKLWLASLGSERIDEIYNPEIAVNRAIEYYRKKGYSDDWIKARITGIVTRKKLTDVWKENGIKHEYEYAILTDEIYKTWSGMKASEYKQKKGLQKEALRDYMSDIEVVLTDLSEITTRDLANIKHPKSLKENLNIAKRGGTISKLAREYYENETGKSVVEDEK